MIPRSGADFRRSIETKILNLHNNTGIPIPTIRKTLVFNRFLARLKIALPHGWVLKGGFFMASIPSKSPYDQGYRSVVHRP